MKKSQMEIIGLAFIVIIILLALIFYAYTNATKKPTTFQKTQFKGQLTTNTLNALMRVTIHCDDILCSPAGNKVQIDELIKNCRSNNNCDSIRGKINEYLRYTFNNKKIKYRFIASYPTEPNPFMTATSILSFDCSAYESDTHIIPQNIEIKLDVC